MPQFTQKPHIITTQIKLSAGAKTAFIDWQAKLNRIIAAFPGFVSLEITSNPERDKESWTIIQRFDDPGSAAFWMDSAERQSLFNELKLLIKEKNFREDSGSSLHGGITQVFIAQVDPEKETEYRQWIARIHQAEARFPGFRGVYVQSPAKGQGRHWITFLQFDTPENLDRWLESPERQEILKESQAVVSTIESHRVISPYAGWFSSMVKIGEAPAVWKETMVILLILFPIVMLELKYLSPITHGLNLSLATFIGNTISVSLISWPMMPIAIWLLGWWLLPSQHLGSRSKVIGGTLLLLVLYLLEIAFFWNF